MDALAGLLDGPRARGAFLLRALLDPPWSIRVEDRAPLTLVAMNQGEAWVLPDAGEPVYVGQGEVAVIRGPDPYTVADAPGTPARAVVRESGVAQTFDGADLCERMSLGVRTWGHRPDAAVRFLVGSYQMQGEVSGRLLDVLPPVLVVPSDVMKPSLLPLLDDEVAREDPGQEVVLDRLLDLLLIGVLRAWFARPEAEAPGWYHAYGDPVVGPALRLLHADPAHPWTVAGLAARVGVSRAALARRFKALVGEAPMEYLANWRIALAADLLREPDVTLAAVARQVGYGSAFALSSAFKRVRGTRPSDHRRLAAR